MEIIKYSLFVFYMFLFCSCHNDVRLAEALDLSGNNRKELEKVLEHYKSDKEKMQAARFLICNIIYHYSYQGILYSPNNCPYELRSNSRKINIVIDSLKKKSYTIRTIVSKDIESIKADFLIENIDLAFLVWRKPWANKLSFNDFCHYILPYRSGEHPISNLRRKLMDKYIPYLEYPDDGMYTFLKNRFCKDVTEEYGIPVTTISVKVDSLLIHQRHFAYLCAYNMGKWKEIALGECSAGYCKVKNVVGDNVFRIAIAQNGALAYITAPFYADMKGNIYNFSSDTICSKEVILRKPRFYRGFRHWEDIGI